MRKATIQAFDAYTDQIALLNGVRSAAKMFTTEPSVQQTLETKIQESSGFLSKINMLGVPDQMGSKVGLGVGGPVAGTTNTDTTDRSTSDISTLDENGYVCTHTNFDTHIPYSKLDAWAKFPDFQARVRDAIIVRQGLDRIMIGWNGVSRAATSDKVANPLLQDVNIGWLQKYRTYAEARVMDEGGAAGEVRVGAAAGRDYFNLDALVMDAVSNLIEPWYQEDTELVVICGRTLLHDKYFPIVDQDQANTEQLAAQLIISQKRIGNLPAVRVPYFPADALMITRLDNLSIYWQEGARRRAIIDNPKRSRIENFESSNEAYVVEDYGCGCVVENIVQTWAAG
jgi:P2 family phage major capsid protein